MKYLELKDNENTLQYFTILKMHPNFIYHYEGKNGYLKHVMPLTIRCILISEIDPFIH